MTSLTEIKVGTLNLYPAFGPFVTEYNVEHYGAGSAVVSAKSFDDDATLSYKFTRLSGGGQISWNAATNTVTWPNNTYYMQAKVDITVTSGNNSRKYTVWLDNAIEA
jgi:hypothetical protein